MAPGVRLVRKKWTDIPGLEHMTRTEILNWNEWLDAEEEAEDVAREKAEQESKRQGRR